MTDCVEQDRTQYFGPFNSYRRPCADEVTYMHQILWMLQSMCCDRTGRSGNATWHRNVGSFTAPRTATYKDCSSDRDDYIPQERGTSVSKAYRIENDTTISPTVISNILIGSDTIAISASLAKYPLLQVQSNGQSLPICQIRRPSGPATYTDVRKTRQPFFKQIYPRFVVFI